MPRLNADLIASGAQYLNALNQFHLDLQECRIPYLENLAATNDQFACIDLTQNQIALLDELPQLLRLETLVLAHNKLSRIAPGFADVCPRLETLILQHNRLTHLAELRNLPRTLKRLVCLDNVVCKVPNYREFLAWHLPNLKILDYQKVSREERDRGNEIFSKAENLPKEAALTVSSSTGPAGAINRDTEITSADHGAPSLSTNSVETKLKIMELAR